MINNDIDKYYVVFYNMPHSGGSFLTGQTSQTTMSVGQSMRLGVIRRNLVWACVAASFAAIITATWHMDYTIDPSKRSGAAVEAALPANGVFSVAVEPVKNMAGPCSVPSLEIAFLR